MKIIKFLEKIPSLENKLYIVTGANSGLGFDLTVHLVSKGAEVILACRNIDKANKAKEQILKEVPTAKMYIEEYDQASFESIENFSNRIIKNYHHIDGLVCNAGVYYPKADYKTKDGFELTFGTNYLGTFKLLHSLRYKLVDDCSRVVIVTSLTATLSNKRIDINQINRLNRNQIYGYSKYCLSRLFYELNVENNNINYYLVHPGIASTNIISSQQTGLPHWFQVLGHRFLTLFTHSSRKASLILLEGLVTENKKKYICPRGLFGISGYPKFKNVPKYASRPIINQTFDLIKEKENARNK